MYTQSVAVIQKTVELCQTILDQPQFLELRRQVEAFLADDGAQTQYRELSEQGASLQQKHQMGVIPADDEISAFETKREAFLRNPVARGFLEAQQTMHDVRETVNRYVARTFELGRVPQQEDFDACACGSGGCAH